MTNSEISAMLRDIAVAAQQDILEAINELISESTDEQRSGYLMERCLAHLDNLSMGAELTQMTALQALCNEFSDTMLGQAGEVGFDLENARTVHQWMADVGAHLEMPNMNGLELTSHIRSDERLRELPVIMITSRTQHKHRRQAQAAGVNAYLTKPYSEEELLDTMDRFIQRA